jgi:hypothetical protein
MDRHAFPPAQFSDQAQQKYSSGNYGSVRSAAFQDLPAGSRAAELTAAAAADDRILLVDLSRLYA